MNVTTRFSFLAVVLVVLPAVIIGFILYRSSEDRMIAEAESGLSFSMQEAGQDLRQSAADARAKVLFVSHLPQILELARAPAQPYRQTELKNELAAIFTSLAETSPDLLQVRLISATENGHEIVRVDRKADRVVRMPDAELQDKGKQDYVVQTLGALPGATLIFGINLNREHQQIEVPHIPVLRVTTPIYGGDGHVFGLVVININMSRVLARMRARFPADADFYLANDNGDFLYHPDPSKTFGFEFGKPYRITDEFPSLAPLIKGRLPQNAFTRTIEGKGGQIMKLARESLDPGNPQQFYLAAAFLPRSAALGPGMASRVEAVLLTVILAVAGAAMAFILSRRLVRPLRELTRVARQIEAGEDGDSLNRAISRRDEIGVLARGFRAMTVALKDRQARIEEKEERIRAILEAAGNPIVTIDGAGIVRSVNAATTELFGYERGELIGSNVSILMNPHDKARHDQYLSDFHLTGRKSIIGVGREVEARCKDGTPIPIHLSVSEVRLKNRLLFTGVMTDLREQKKLDRLKNEFVSTVSHELRTPLTSIKGSLAILKSSALGKLPEPLRQMIEIADSNSDRLVRLVNDILDIEKIEAGKLSFRLARVDLYEFLKNMVDANLGHASTMGVRLANGGAPKGLMLSADPDRLAQVVSNLLSNAIKYTPRGGTVTVSASANESNVRVMVIDEGPGIPESFQDKIFSKFAQADASSTRAQGGTGLGLAISKAIIAAHGGTIGFTTRPGEGSVFYFDLPTSQLRPVPDAQPPADVAGAA